MSQKPSIPQGTRDFSPLEMARRRYIFSKIENVFRSYGFKQIETPSFENLSTLTGKYGDEGDKLLFKILNSGDYLSKAPSDLVKPENSKELIKYIADRGLRYDLTVPFARYVVMHQHEFSFPFKRFQIQPVWRADRPQKGRYREFYQCDADIVGSDSLIYEAELTSIYDKAFADLNIPVSIRINNRKILEGIAIDCGFGDQFVAFTVIIDKLDKIGEERVKEELGVLGGDAEKAISLLSQRVFSIDSVTELRGKLPNDIAQKGCDELEEIANYLQYTNLQNEVLLDTTLARGLNYYTGTIYEVLAKEVKMGSIGGGGRYDDLTGIFGLKDVSGVGISFGADRIYDVLLEMSAFPEMNADFTQVLICPMDEESKIVAFELAQNCRNNSIRTEVYPEASKLKKQLGYADSNQIPFAVIIGENERLSGNYSVKNLTSGEQQSLNTEELIKLIHSV